MSELAYDLNGEPITLPASAQWWKVRRFRNPGMRGAPEVVIDREGSPLFLPTDASFVEFREAVDAIPGRYRLDPLDERRKTVGDVPAAYVTLTEAPRGVPVGGASVEDRDSVIRELVRAQADMVKTMSERFSNVMQAAAELLRAADGAGLPARPPMALEFGHDDDTDDESEEVAAAVAAPAGIDINALVAQVVPVIVTNLVNGKLDLSKLGALLDWRKAAASGKAATAPTNARPASETAPPAKPASEALPALDPAAMAHFIAIQSALTPAEANVAREVAKDLSPAELREWIADLSAMSVADAVAKIRSMIGGAHGGGVS